LFLTDTNKELSGTLLVAIPNLHTKHFIPTLTTKNVPQHAGELPYTYQGACSLTPWILTVQSLSQLGSCTCPQLCLKLPNYYTSLVVGAVWLATLSLITLQIYNVFLNCANILWFFFL